MIPIHKFTLDSYIPEEEELLEYVERIALKYCPDIDINENGEPYICGTQAVRKFKSRYNRNLLNNQFDYNGYITVNIDNPFRHTLEALGVDLEKFWYLLLFVYDFSLTTCWDAFKLNQSPKDDLMNFAETVRQNIERIHPIQGVIFSKDCTLTLSIKGKHSFNIDNPTTIAYIAELCNNAVDNISFNSFMDRGSIDIHNTKTESDAVLIWHFAKMFLDFFDMHPEFKGRQKKGDTVSLSKNLLISRLIYFTHISMDNKLLESDELLKSYIKRYKNHRLTTLNSFY